MNNFLKSIFYYYKNKTFIKAIVLLLFTVIIIYLSLANLNQDNNIKVNIPYLDKLIHFFMYFIYSIIILFSLKNKSITHYMAIFYCISFGIIMEIIQEYGVSNRTGDIIDALSNTAGVLTGYFSFRKINDLQ